ncbi:MAG: RdgB/HAM1 family non-canonical purine NTP pyrophosphatase [Alistipes sp.]|jgi:XTP/dITP diphosphohydrolase|nr:RdgB/HAM1 family non-canonical purine NTP pyrophosphatase [Alistipes sp.]
MRIVFATNNRHKLEEVAAILGPGVELITPADLGITEDIPETADTLEGNALLKARYVYERTLDATENATKSAAGVPTFADDTGLEVAALGGAPGVRSARYAADAGEKDAKTGAHNFEANNRLLLKNMEAATDRSANFRTVIALIVDGREHLFDGRVDGRIIDEYRGAGGFGYDPVFIPSGGEATFAEMPLAEKNMISHRARAVEKLAAFLSNYKSKL